MRLDLLLVPDLVNSLCLKGKVCSHFSDSTCLSEPSQGLSLKEFRNVATIGNLFKQQVSQIGIAIDKCTVYKS